MRSTRWCGWALAAALPARCLKKGALYDQALYSRRVDPAFAIVTWTSNNPGGAPEHYGVVRYGTNPKDLSQTAKSPIRLNPGHPDTVFRVRMEDLKPGTTYYYKVNSMEANGKDDGVKSIVKHFTTEPNGKDDVAKSTAKPVTNR